MEIKSKIWIEKGGKLVFGTGKSLILKAIDKTGSINKAAKQMNMSYRMAWSYIKTIEQRLGKPLLIKERGGEKGGGAVLTQSARNLIEKFEKLEKDVKSYVDKKYKIIFSKNSGIGGISAKISHGSVFIKLWKNLKLLK